MVVEEDLALANDDVFGCLLGVPALLLVATGWRGESLAAAAVADADEATEAAPPPPLVRVDRRVAAVAVLLLLMVALPSKINEFSI